MTWDTQGGGVPHRVIGTSADRVNGIETNQLSADEHRQECLCHKRKIAIVVRKSYERKAVYGRGAWAKSAAVER